MLAHVQLAIHQYPQVFLNRAVLYLLVPQLVFIAGIAMIQVPDHAFGFVEPYEVHLDPLLKPVYIPLDGTSSLWCVDCTPQLIVISKLAEGALDPLSLSLMKILKSIDLNTDS